MEFTCLLISIPTLVFIMGLSFLLMSVIRNQAITFVLILGYIGITLFLLQAKYYYIFDYMAFNIPMLSSDIVGFGNFETILIHRGIYFSWDWIYFSYYFPIEATSSIRIDDSIFSHFQHYCLCWRRLSGL